MAADAGDDAAADPLDVDRAVEPHLERGVARDEARDPREATDVVGLLDRHEPEPAVDGHGDEVVATPEVRGLGGTVEQPARVERDEGVTGETGQEAHGLPQRAHHRVADPAGAVLHRGARGHERRDVLADGEVGGGRFDRRGRDQRARAGDDRDDVAGDLGRAEIGRVLVELDDHRAARDGRRRAPIRDWHGTRACSPAGSRRRRSRRAAARRPGARASPRAAPGAASPGRARARRRARSRRAW